VSEVATLPLA